MKHDRPDVQASLDRLTASEAELLELLGQGHTAKSIANLKGISVHSVNERFRSAREKTGVGSSRELARLVRSKKVGPDFIGLTSPEGTGSKLEQPRPRRIPRGVMIGMVTMLGAGTLALFLVVQTAPSLTGQSGTPRVASDTAAAMFLGEPSMRELHGTLRAHRATTTSATAEDKLRKRYQQAPGFAGVAAELRVTCRGDLCEVAIKAPDLPREVMSEFVLGMQSRALDDSLGTAGFTAVIKAFGAADSGGSDHVAYWKRSDVSD